MSLCPGLSSGLCRLWGSRLCSWPQHSPLIQRRLRESKGPASLLLHGQESHWVLELSWRQEGFGLKRFGDRSLILLVTCDFSQRSLALCMAAACVLWGQLSSAALLRLSIIMPQDLFIPLGFLFPPLSSIWMSSKRTKFQSPGSLSLLCPIQQNQSSVLHFSKSRKRRKVG